MTAFYDYFRARLDESGFASEDAVASLAPLVRQTIEAHAAGFVAPLDGVAALQVEGNRLWFEEAKRERPRHAESELRRIEATPRSAVEIVGEYKVVTDVDDGERSPTDLAIGDLERPIERPVYLPDWRCWEGSLGHRDPLTDVFSLGMLLASLACNLDFREPRDLEEFVQHRKNLFEIAPLLHPSLARLIVRMTELDRRRRPQDLPTLLQELENYRDRGVDLETQLAQDAAFRTSDRRTKQAVVLRKLRERLFEISRRNRLLDFRATTDSLNLTQASVPLSFDVKNVRPDQLLVWNEGIQRELAEGKSLSLDRYLNFAEALYVPSVLDRIAAESRRDRAEYGFAQLRLVACFLRWTNLKEKPVERFDSPLVLIPVELVKKKGVRDAYYLRPLASEGELNPVVRYRLKQLYDIDLPATIDLASSRLDDLHELLAKQVRASEPGVAIEKIDKPRITLIHEKARRRLDQYRRTARLSGRGVRRLHDLDYSYDPANYHPLGLKLFAAKIRPPETHLRTLIEERPRPRTFVVPEQEPPVVEKEKSLYALSREESNPYGWEFDLCSVTVANFRYRRMSLVRDYDALVDADGTNPAFEATFSLDPKSAPTALPETPPLSDRFDVLPCDPTQATAIAQAREGASYIVQGPPGTGKSQTIANLIADFVARGKRVLFVCEKRAAIDVVYARLKQCGLGELCCLIHDSQTDKKEFVMDLKATYEAFSAAPDEKARGAGRDETLARLSVELAPLEAFDAAMRTTTTGAGETLRTTIGRAIELRSGLPEISGTDREKLPRYDDWRSSIEPRRHFEQALRAVRSDGVFARHPLRIVSPRVADAERPLALATAALDAGTAALLEVERRLTESGVVRERWSTLAAAKALTGYARSVETIAAAGQLALLDSAGERSRAFDASLTEWTAKRRAVEDLYETSLRWRQRIPKEDLAAATEQAKRFEGSWFAWLQPAWWRLRGALVRGYDFKAHTIRPSWAQVLAGLADLYGREQTVADATRAMQERFAFAGEVDDFRRTLAELRGLAVDLPPNVAAVHREMLASAGAGRTVARLAAAHAPIQETIDRLSEATEGFADRSIGELRTDLDKARRALEGLPAFLPCLRALGALPPGVSAAVRELELPLPQLEAATAAREATDRLRSDPQAGDFDAPKLVRQAEAVEALYDLLLGANAREVRRRVESRFRERLRICATPAGQLSDAEKTLKKVYTQGRRDLEREFNKSMRYRAIRELVSGESGEVVKDLKPVWLMSPVSVSDTLPLDDRQFDVAIFDEASQITLEEAAPSLFRATQTIVVGDQMQLPPTAFFASKSEDDEELLVEHEGELVAYDLESASFLGHAARNLPSTMLGWHYRSRSESLVSFSNWAFYDGRLLTVPEENLPGDRLRPIVVESIDASSSEAANDENEESKPADLGGRGADDLLGRAVSFHHLPRGVYDRRRNRAEAEYVASVLRSLLRRRSGLTFGVVAFSETQQSEIESALDRLADEDREFRDLLDAEREREENGQFVGLLVKNLENIQGDERDVIVLSVCYGRDPQGAVRMNFGPINLSGGEKRLNVAFSRAKRHMAIVSSMRFADIKNDYNEGANCFKNYLKYAEAMSEGDTATASRVLQGLSRAREERSIAAVVQDALADQLVAALQDRDWVVDRDVGQSHFRVDLGVRREGETLYRLGILLDAADRYERSSPLEREVQRPRLLRDFGWNVDRVVAAEWHRDPEATIARLVARLEALAPK